MPPAGFEPTISAGERQELKQRIQQEVKRIPVEMLQRVTGDVPKRLAECLERNVGRLTDVIFGK